MADLDPKDRAALDEFVANLRDLFASSLRAVLLTGEAASEGYREKLTPLATLVLLDTVTPEALRRARPRLPAWRRRRIVTPLFLDPAYVERSLDVFPLEFLEIRDRHRLLHGEADPFRESEIRIDEAHLRLEVEEQLRGKMLHLWEAYLNVGGDRRDLSRLLRETPADFEVALRGLLHLVREPSAAGAPPPASSDDLLAAVESHFGVALPTFHRLGAVRRGESALDPDELDPLFERYLDEVRALVRLTDAL